MRTLFSILYKKREICSYSLPLLFDNISIQAGFGYDKSVSLQTDDTGHVGAAVLAHMACVVGL